MLHLVRVTMFLFLLLCSDKVSPTAATSGNTNEIVFQIPYIITVYKNGTVVRPGQTPFVPPALRDPETGVSSKDVVISKKPSVCARLYLPKLTRHHRKVPILVYIHGGGFVLGSAFAQPYHSYLTKLVSQIPVIAVSVEYRLAPEYLLPAAYHDSWAALKWVLFSHSVKNLTFNNYEPWLVHYGDFNRVFIGGDSAGANIAHYLALRAGDQKLPGGVKLLGAFCAHPYFQGSKPIGSERTKWPKDVLWNFVYPSAPGGIDNPLINPEAPGAPSLARLGSSKLLVCVAGNDFLRDRGVLYYEALKKSGWKGKPELFEQKGEGHIYHILHPDSENGKKMMKRLASFILGY